LAEYVRDMAHTNGLESVWAPMNRRYNGIYRKMSPKHPQRHVEEFLGRHNNSPKDTLDRMGSVVRGMSGRCLSYKALIAPNGLPSGARS